MSKKGNVAVVVIVVVVVVAILRYLGLCREASGLSTCLMLEKLCQIRVNQYHIWGLPEEFMTCLQKQLIPGHLNFWNEKKFGVNKISDKFATSFAQVG